jgi:lipopolysaccharide transport system ATP-binding protein
MWAANKAAACCRTFWALDDISFEVTKGQTVGIIGRNGSGKSTLLQIICGTLDPSCGEVAAVGRVAALLELGSGFNPEYTGRENVYLNGQLHGLSRIQIDERFDEIAAFADIGDFIDQPVKTYSSGMFVRLAFAVIAHVDADILIIDEALAVGDAFFTQKCMRFLRRFMKTGTVLFVSHDTSSVKGLCSHAIWLEKGRVLDAGDPKDVCDAYLAAFFEAQQGKSTTTRLHRVPQVRSKPELTRDQRQDVLNHSPFRNDLQLFHFDPTGPSFGKGGGEIIGVEFLDNEGHRLTWMVGGEKIVLRVEAFVGREMESPIIGFYIKDRLGQTLFGDNTFLTYQDRPLICEPGATIVAQFAFLMPTLPKGDYSVCVALAEGTQDSHVHHHWIHDALMFRSETTSVLTGLVGIPMAQIEMYVE